MSEEQKDPSPGPYRVGYLDPDKDAVELIRDYLSRGSGKVWAVMLPEDPNTIGGWEERPEYSVVLCITGNGPRSEANAYEIAARLDAADRLRALLPEVVAKVERIAKQPTVDEYEEEYGPDTGDWEAANDAIVGIARDLLTKLRTLTATEGGE